MTKKCKCGKPAIWQRLRKKDEHLEPFLCDGCLMEDESPSKLIDNYKYCGD
jgi:hypothetical protein